MHAIDVGVAGSGSCAFVNQPIAFENCVRQRAFAFIGPERRLYLEAHRRRAIERHHAAGIEIVHHKPDNLMGRGQSRLIGRREQFRRAVRVELRRVGAVAVNVIEGRALLPRPLGPVAGVARAHGVNLRLCDLSNVLQIDLCGVACQIGAKIVPANTPDTIDPWVAEILSRALRQNAAGYCAGCVGLAADTNPRVGAVIDNAAPDDTILKNDTGGATRKDNAGVARWVIPGRAVRINPHGHIVDVDQRAVRPKIGCVPLQARYRLVALAGQHP